jgi:hypothetical protein
MTALEMYEEMARNGFFQPAMNQQPLEMPTMLQSVPTITTYSTPAAPLTMGVETHAGLEARSRRDRG